MAVFNVKPVSVVIYTGSFLRMSVYIIKGPSFGAFRHRSVDTGNILCKKQRRLVEVVEASVKHNVVSQTLNCSVIWLLDCSAQEICLFSVTHVTVMFKPHYMDKRTLQTDRTNGCLFVRLRYLGHNKRSPFSLHIE